MIWRETDKPVIMGILNLTPDSFSDGGKYMDCREAVSHAKNMLEAGADIIDIGGESTRPGSKRVPAREQNARILDVVKAIRDEVSSEALISIDTTRAEVALAALEAGGNIINDISAGRDDPDLIHLVVEKKCPYIIMHMQGTPETMQDNPTYNNVVDEIRSFLLERIDHLQSSGIGPDNIVIDPGIGFGKTRDHNLEILANLKCFVDTGYPVLLGASRKRFMGTICQETHPEALISATCATTALGVATGVRLFRVHDIRENRQAAYIAWEINNCNKAV